VATSPRKKKVQPYFYNPRETREGETASFSPMGPKRGEKQRIVPQIRKKKDTEGIFYWGGGGGKGEKGNPKRMFGADCKRHQGEAALIGLKTEKKTMPRAVAAGIGKKKRDHIKLAC